MKRVFSEIVIFLLLVIAPVSFSTDKIPNFDKPATKSYQIRASRKISIAIIEQPINSEDIPRLLYPKKTFINVEKSAPFNSTLEFNSGRAPPVFIPV